MAAEVIKIEIPVEVQDKTAAGVSSVTGNLNRMAQAANKNRMLGTGTYGKAFASLEKYNRVAGRTHAVELKAEDHVSPVLHDIEDGISRVGGLSAEVEIQANDLATMEIDDASDALAALSGDSAEVEIGADDTATPQINDVSDATAALDGETADVELGADDNASEVIHYAEDTLATFDGSSGTAEIGVDDNATEAIANAMSMLDEYEQRMQSMSNLNSGLDSGLRSGGSHLRGLAMGAAGFLGVSMGVGSAINTFKDFEAAMSQVEAISGATESEMGQLTAKAKELGATTKFTATQSAEAFNYMGMAGWKTEDMLGGIDGIMNLAAASGESLGTTSDIVTDALTAFGLEASDSTHFADVMAQASANANTNVGMLGESFKYVAPLAGAMNYSIEDTALALGLMANAGVKSSMAGTSLRTAISNLAAPTKQMREGMEKYGISLTDDEGKMKSLRGVMESTRKALKGLSEDEQTAAVKSIFGKNSMSGMLAIINSTEDDWNKLTEAVDNSDGAAERMAKIMMDNLAGSITLLQSAYEGVQDTFGERVSPYARGIVDAITGAMPDASQAIETVMDKVDMMADKFETSMRKMTSSDEWQQADLLGKIDIAWDTLVVQPFSDWAGGEGLEAVSGIVTGLFENAFKILPGGEAPGLTSWLSAGLLGFGALKIGGLASDFSALAASIAEMAGADSIIGSFATAAGGIAGPAFAAAAGIGALALAINNYNAQEIKANLADHFGDLSLTQEQSTTLAEQILDIPYTANLKVASVQFDEADDLMSKAEEALAQSKKINWKVNSVHLEMTDADKSSLIDNKDEFISSIKEAMESKEYGMEEAVKGVLGPEAGSAIAEEMQSWFTEDMVKVDGLSAAITGVLEEALNTGTYDVNAATAVQIMQQKMMQIANASREARQRAELDYLQLTANGAALDPDSWKNVVSEMNLMRENLKMDDKEGYLSLLEYFEGAQLNGHIDDSRKSAIMDMIQQSMNQTEQRSLANEWGWISNSLHSAYGEELTKALGNAETGEVGTMATDAQKRIGTTLREMQGGTGITSDMLETRFLGLGNGLDSAATGALADRYSVIRDSVDEMQSLIDSANEKGQEVPEALYSSYKDALSIGAASGDLDAIYGYVANQIFESGEYDNFMKAVEESGTQVPQAFGEALKRAAKTTTAPDADFSEMWNGLQDTMLEDGTIDLNKVDEWMKKYGQTIGDYIGEHGAETTGEGLSANMGEMLGSVQDLKGASYVSGGKDERGVYQQYEVQPGNTLSGIASTNNMDMSQLIDWNMADYPQLAENPNYIESGWKFKIYPEEMDTSAVEEAMEDPAVEGEPAEVEQQADVTYTLGEQDTSEIEESMSEDLDGLVDEVPLTGTAQATLDQTNNAAEVRSGVEADVQSAMSESISASTSVIVHLNWQIANPTASVSVGVSGGSATATIASADPAAEGAYLDAPHLLLAGEDGPEFIVPVSSKHRDRGIELWREAGAALGMPAYADGGVVGGSVSPVISGAPVATGESDGGTTGETKQISITVNPSIVVNGGDGASIGDQADQIADQIAQIIAERIGEVFDNMPESA